MRLISINRKAVREALAQEGWRFALVHSLAEFKDRHNDCRNVWLPVGSESHPLRILRQGFGWQAIRNQVIGTMVSILPLCGRPTTIIHAGLC